MYNIIISEEYLNHTKAACDGILGRVHMMILREHLLTIDLLIGNPKTVCARHYDHITHEIPDMLEWWNTPIGRDNVILVQYDAGAYMFAILPDGYSVRMLADVKISAFVLRYFCIDTCY